MKSDSPAPFLAERDELANGLLEIVVGADRIAEHQGIASRNAIAEK